MMQGLLHADRTKVDHTYRISEGEYHYWEPTQSTAKPEDNMEDISKIVLLLSL